MRLATDGFAIAGSFDMLRTGLIGGAAKPEQSSVQAQSCK
jgi:hypothetical protein